jgi:hypothetical protein
VGNIEASQMSISGNNKSKVNSWRSNPDHIASELKSRRLYGETRGTKFETDTLVVRKNITEAQGYTTSSSSHIGTTPQPEQSRGMQMSLFGSGSSKGLSRSSSNGGNKGSYSGFFEKMAREAESAKKAADSGQPLPATGGSTSSWVKGMSSAVPSDKRAALERHLRRVQEMASSCQAAGVSPLQTAQPQTFSQTHVPQAMSAPMEVANELPSAPAQAAEAVASVGLNRELFLSVRNRIGGLLLHELPPEVTSELRQIGKELEQLADSVSQV